MIRVKVTPKLFPIIVQSVFFLSSFLEKKKKIGKRMDQGLVSIVVLETIQEMNRRKFPCVQQLASPRISHPFRTKFLFAYTSNNTPSLPLALGKLHLASTPLRGTLKFFSLPPLHVFNLHAEGSRDLRSMIHEKSKNT